MNDQVEKFARPRLASGALFVEASKILLVHKTYGNGWDIPGGYVDRGESPALACEREVREEINLTKKASRLLVHDWAPSDREGDKILYIFDCGKIEHPADEIQLDHVEIDAIEWVNLDELDRFVIPRLQRRLTHAYSAHVSGDTLYLEHGSLAGIHS